MKSEAELRFSRKKGIFALWTAWFIGPTAWMLHLNISYLAVPWICVTGNYRVLHLITAAALLLTAGGAFIAWRSWRQAGRERPGAADWTVSRSHFMAIGGLSLNGLFFLIILAQGIANFMVDACQ